MVQYIYARYPLHNSKGRLQNCRQTKALALRVRERTCRCQRRDGSILKRGQQEIKKQQPKGNAAASEDIT